jgi:hypothetical protein
MHSATLRVPSAGDVREGSQRDAQALVARPAELRVLAFARFDRDGRLVGVGGNRVTVRVAQSAVPDLAPQRRCADDRASRAEEAAEDLAIGMRIERVGDL